MATQVADLSEINPHLALLHSESFISECERGWFRFVRKVEKLLGHGIDGNQKTDGFSLDYAADSYADGWTAEEYVSEVQADVAELDAALGPLLSLPAPCGRYL
jgi:hypothetical protein